MSSGDESHSVSRLSGMQGSELPVGGSSAESSSAGASLAEERLGEAGTSAAGTNSGEEEEVPARGRPSASRRVSRVGPPPSSTRPSAGPSSEVSVLTGEDVANLRATYGVPEGFQFLAPGPEDRVDSGPSGSLAVYEEDLVAGLRFPLHPAIRDILHRFSIVPAQLGPNSVRVLTCFVVLCRLAGVQPRLALFRPFFTLNRLPGSKGWFFFGPRKGRKLFSLPSSIHHWKTRFFFVSSDQPWGIRTEWSEPDFSANRNDRVNDADRGDFALLSGAAVPPLRELLTEQNLFDAGASPVNSLGKSVSGSFSLVRYAPTVANLEFDAAGMRIVSGDAVRAALQKKRPAEAEKKKAAVAKRPKTMGPTVGQSASTARAPTEARPAAPRVTVLPPRAPAAPAPGAEVQAVVPPAPPAPAPVTNPPRGVANSRPDPASVPIVAVQAPAEVRVPPSESAGPSTAAATGASSSRAGSVGAPSAQGAEARPSGPDHQTSVVREKTAEGWEFRVRTGVQDSAVHNSAVARELCRPLLHPRDSREWEGRSVHEVVEGAFSNLARWALDLTAIRSVVVRYADNAHRWEEQARSAGDRAAQAELERNQALQREKDLRAQMAQELGEKDRAFAAEHKRLENALSLRRAAEDRYHGICDLRKIAKEEAKAAGERAKAAQEEAKAAEGRAKAAEEKAVATERRAQMAEEEAKAAREEAKVAEERALAAERRADRAVSEYKDSDAFEADAAEAATGIYVVGFTDCRRMVAEAYPYLDLGGVSYPGESDPAGDTEDEVVEVPAPGTSAAEAPAEEGPGP